MAPDKMTGYIGTTIGTISGIVIVTECRTMKDRQRNATSPKCVIPGDVIDIDVQELDVEVEDRVTHHFLKAVRGTIEPRTGPAKEAHQRGIEDLMAVRVLCDVALLADAAARHEVLS